MLRLSFLVREGAAHRGLHSKRIKETRRHCCPGETLRLISARQIVVAGSVRDNLLAGVILRLPFSEIARCHRADRHADFWIALPEHDQPILIRKREWPQQER